MYKGVVGAAEGEAEVLVPDMIQGPRIFDWARVEVRPWHRGDRRHWAIARRSVSRPQEISYYIAYCPADTTLDQVIHVAGARWAVEECFQTAKQECGLDDYQVRRYPGWHRHLNPGHGRPGLPHHPAGPRTGRRQSRNGSSGLVLLSLPELRRLIARLAHRQTTPVDQVLHWSHWRRRRQSRPDSATANDAGTFHPKLPNRQGKDRCSTRVRLGPV